MRFTVISDIHGNITALDAVFNHVQDSDCILCAGDFSGYYYGVNDVIEKISSKNNFSILGNHDLYLLDFMGKEIYDTEIKKTGFLSRKKYKEKYGLGLETTIASITKKNIEYLQNLKLSRTIQIGDKIIQMFHGSPWNPFSEYIYPDFGNWEKFLEIDADIFVLGHTHYPFIKNVGNKLIINPGSVGQPRDYDPRASYITFDTANNNALIHRVEYNIEELIREIDQIEPNNMMKKKILKRTKDLNND